MQIKNEKDKTTSNFNQTRNDNQQYDLISIFKDFQIKINRDLNVASFAIVEKVDNRSVYCKPFPIRNETSSYTIIAYLINANLEINKDDIVLIIFTDRDYRTCLDNITQDSNYTTDDSNLHSINYGVVLTKIENKQED